MTETIRRYFTPGEMDAMSTTRTLADDTRRLLDLLDSMHGIDPNWLQIGKLAIQLGFMAIEQSISTSMRL